MPTAILAAAGYVPRMMGTAPRRPAHIMNSLCFMCIRIPHSPIHTAIGLDTNVSTRNNTTPSTHRLAHWFGKTSSPISANMPMLAIVEIAAVKLATPCLCTNGWLPST